MWNVATLGEVSLKLDTARRQIRCAIVGAVSPQQVFDAMDSLKADPSYSPDFDALIDFREFSGKWTYDDVRQIGQRAHEDAVSPGARRAIVVTEDWQDDLIRGLQGATLFSPVIYRPFRTMEAAEAWLAERRLVIPALRAR